MFHVTSQVLTQPGYAVADLVGSLDFFLNLYPVSAIRDAIPRWCMNEADRFIGQRGSVSSGPTTRVEVGIWRGQVGQSQRSSSQSMIPLKNPSTARIN